MALIELIQELYLSEINASVTSFWDGGFDVALGDEKNGFLAEQNFDAFSLEKEATQWLHEVALKHYPKSTFAQNANEPTPTSIAQPTADNLGKPALRKL